MRNVFEPREKLAALKPINFIFGSNGAGKTTISRVINDPSAYASCALTWEKSQALVSRVYNSDFVSRNFAQQLPGIFTLGEAAGDTLDKIDDAKSGVKALEDDIARLNGTLRPAEASSGKRGELRTLRTQLEGDCWKIKGKHDPHFKDAGSPVCGTHRRSSARRCWPSWLTIPLSSSTLAS
ncbi:wobble nucleotide-excising tRNase [Bradyrhizobium ottawaense]|uniref:AAA family ATPase n=1 Tax=Bradyrhizobium ottawaense TaxID=931866 RepID=UPI0035120CCB